MNNVKGGRYTAPELSHYDKQQGIGKGGLRFGTQVKPID